MKPIHRLGVKELAAAYRAGELSPQAVTEHMVARISELDPGLRAFIQLDPEGAREAAQASGGRIAAGDLRPLEGVPIAVKANIDVAGLDTSCGIEARRGMAAAADAEAVARLRAAGAIILGTLNMHEAALGADSDNPWFGRVLNPHGEQRTPGGSSGGSGAAVAAGLCVASLGTDTLGSVRIPAAYCGVYGLKPGRGRVSQQGLELVEQSFDTIGPLARTLDDLEAVFEAIAEAPRPRDIQSVSLLYELGGVGCEPAVLDAYARAIEALVAEGFHPTEKLALELKAIRLAGFVEAARELGDRLAPLREAKPEGISNSLSFLLDYGARSDPDPALLAKTAASVREAVGEGVLLMPTAPQAAFVHGSRAPANQADFTALASIAGLPALSMPAGLDAQGMPVGVQIVGVEGNELGLIALARQLEKHLGGSPPPPNH
jgi:aspartyl-tRNA(Asn)/glutamyl-tRNA(Gln) amidotransferase subunit A